MAELRNSRISHDVNYMMQNPVDGIFLDEVTQLLDFNAFISGPAESPYEGGLFKLRVKVPRAYPYKPLEISFETLVFHPNVAPWGTICLDLLDSEWVPSIHLIDALEAVQGLLRNPNEYSPLNGQAGRWMRRSPELFQNTAITWTSHFAGGPRTVPEMEEKIEILTALGRTKEYAIKMLTRADWSMASLKL